MTITVPQERMRMSDWSRQWILEAGQSLEASALAVCSCILNRMVGWMDGVLRGGIT